MAKLFSLRTLVLGALAAAAAYAYKNRSTAAPAGSGGGGPAPYVPSPAPMPSNVDVAGPPENTATAVPAPDPLVHAPEGGIDEQAEIDAAAAEAANIGGAAPDYPDTIDEGAAVTDADRPLEEAGGGSSEGLELAEADLVENFEDPAEAEAAVEAAIEAQDDPAIGETPETPVSEIPPPPLDPPDDKSTAVWSNDEQATVEAPAVTDEGDNK